MGVATSAPELIDRLSVAPRQLAELAVDLRAAVAASASTIVERRDAGEAVFPELRFAEVATGSVSPESLAAIKSAGCVVVRATFERSEAEAWDAELAEYVAANDFRRRLFDDKPDTSTGSRIWPVYWSRPQVLARQHDHMGVVRRFLNGLWRHQSQDVEQDVKWFEPELDIGYPDRIRRREPGAVAKGLAMHCDAPSAGGWRLEENQSVFAPLLTGGLEAFDPWDAAHRTGFGSGGASAGVESPVGSSVFRTFQGWTALSDMDPSDGVLQVAPLPIASGYRLVRGLAGELGLIEGESAAPAVPRDHGDDLIASALVPIPVVAPGDTVWWQGDLFHAVGDASNRSRWGNVMYIGAAPRCARNDAYATGNYARFEAGRSPVDFPPDDYEVDFAGRATPADLNPAGRAQFGLG